MFFFAWLRQKAKEAVLCGIADAAGELADPLADGPAAESVTALRELLSAPRLSVESSSNGNGHAEPVSAGRNKRKVVTSEC